MQAVGLQMDDCSQSRSSMEMPLEEQVSGVCWCGIGILGDGSKDCRSVHLRGARIWASVESEAGHGQGSYQSGLAIPQSFSDFGVPN